MLNQAWVALFTRFWDKLYQKDWYVFVRRKLPNARFTAQYIGRYTKKPVLAESRIKAYDSKSVSFEYEDKTAKLRKVTTLPVEEFMIRLVRHIPDKHFRQIRYYGFYSNRTRRDDLAKAKLILKQTAGKKLTPLNWRLRRKIQNGGHDPLICHRCKVELVLVKIVYKSRDGPLKEIIFEQASPSAYQL